MVDIATLKPGDKVRVTYDECLMLEAVSSMDQMRGEILTIRTATAFGITVEENNFIWSAACFDYPENSVSLLDLLTQC